LDAGEIRVNFHVLGGFRYDISVPQAGSCKRFHGQNRRFMAPEVRGFFELPVVSNFVVSSKKFKIKFNNRKLLQNFSNHQCTHKQY
jgi:hypothetical protein